MPQPRLSDPPTLKPNDHGKHNTLASTTLICAANKDPPLRSPFRVAPRSSRSGNTLQRQPQRPKCSSLNVFSRQLAALLAQRSGALVKETTARNSNGGGDSGGGSGGGGSGGGSPLEFAPKLFVVLDNAEALLSENIAGIGVSELRYCPLG